MSIPEIESINLRIQADKIRNQAWLDRAIRVGNMQIHLSRPIPDSISISENAKRALAYQQDTERKYQSELARAAELEKQADEIKEKIREQNP